MRDGGGLVRSLSHASARTALAASDAFIIASRLDSLNLKGIVGLLLVLTRERRRCLRPLRSVGGGLWAVSVELPRLVRTQPYGRQTVTLSTQRCSVVGPWDM